MGAWLPSGRRTSRRRRPMNKARLGTAAARAAADGVCQLLNGGTLELWSGDLPASPDVEPRSESHRLAVLRFADPAFETSVNGVAAARSITDGFGLQIGMPKATWFRTRTRDGIAVFDGTVGSDGDLLLAPALIRQNAK